MSALDQAVAALEARRSREEAERQERRRLACGFLRELDEADIRPSQKLRQHGIEAAFDGSRLVLKKPQEGHYADGLLIVVGEQGEVDVAGRSLGRVGPQEKDRVKQELLAEIIAQFSL